jgi:AcrR family transcriptional regulator
MRIVKEPEERKAEILNAAEKLFAAEGYERVSVNDIINAVGLSKGAFYYYFKSKEEVLDEIIEKRISNGIKRAEEILTSPLSPLQKCAEIIFAQQFRGEYEHILLAFQNEGSVGIRSRSAALKKYEIQYIIRLSPFIGKIIEEGVEAGLFSTSFPVESAQMLLCVGYNLFDWNSFPWTEDEAKAKITAFLVAIERVLGAKAGTFLEFQAFFPGDIFYPNARGG